MWRSGRCEAPKTPAVTVNVHDSQTPRPIHAAAIRPAPATDTVPRRRVLVVFDVTSPSSWVGVAKVHAVTRAHGGRTATMARSVDVPVALDGARRCEFRPSPFGGLLEPSPATAHADSGRIATETPSYECVGVLEGHRDEVNGLAFAPNAPLSAWRPTTARLSSGI